MNVLATDWLASKPVFYNEATCKISHNINDVVDWANLEFDPEGLFNYLTAGYSVFEHTPIRGVRMLPHSSTVAKDEATGKLAITSENDDVVDLLDKPVREQEVIDLLIGSVQEWESESTGPIVVPTSGGFDSRILDIAIRDKSRIRAFTYGVSEDQEASREVVYAKELSKILGIDWAHVQVGEFHDYLEQWDQLYGASTHSHGMYHLEFFDRIMRDNSDLRGSTLLSGIIGDAWAGSLSIAPVDSPQQVESLYYSHGMCADGDVSLLPHDSDVQRQRFFEEERDSLRNENYRIVAAMRVKLTLLSLLLRLPENVGLKPWSPFLVKEVAIGMLNIEPRRRRRRVWQEEFFAKHGCDLENMHLKANTKNDLNLQAMSIRPLKPLDGNLLREVIDPKYVEWVNSQIGPEGWGSRLKRRGLATRNVRRILRGLGCKDDRVRAYFSYLTLKPLEFTISKRNAA